MAQENERRSVNSAAWVAFLTVASVAMSLGFACATPLAAFGTYAALKLPRPWALGLVVAVWLAGQVVGFGFLSFPLTKSAFSWGAALGISGVLAYEAARRARERGLTLSFLAAFVAYECFLFVCTIVSGSSLYPYKPMVMGRVFLINAIAFAAIIFASKIADRWIGSSRRAELSHA